MASDASSPDDQSSTTTVKQTRTNGAASSDPEIIGIECSDGERLSGSLFETNDPGGAVLVAPATAVSQRFYHPFCRWLTEQGYSALTFDYRGIGASLGERDLTTVSARKQDWGQFDMAAALDGLREKYPERPLYLVGHSSGGQLVGLMENHDELEAIVQVASSTGYVGGSPWPFRWLSWFLLSTYVPATAKLLGYVPNEVIGWGEDLPAGVGLQWAEWCLSPGYLETSFGNDIQTHYYDQLDVPVLSLSATDDSIASNTNVDDLLRLFPDASITKRRLEPGDYGFDEIGHMNFFHTKSREKLWPMVLEGLK